MDARSRGTPTAPARHGAALCASSPGYHPLWRLVGAVAPGGDDPGRKSVTSAGSEAPPEAHAMAGPPEDSKLLLSTTEVAHALGVSERFVKQLIHAGSLPSFKVGRLRRVSTGDLLAWIDRQRSAGRPTGLEELP
jgi:excisionase family DNA binding protein